MTLARFRRPALAAMKGLPVPLVAAMRAAVARLGRVEWVLLGGHPTRRELAAGVRADGKPVSRFNVWCDRACRERAAVLTGGTA